MKADVERECKRIEKLAPVWSETRSHESPVGQQSAESLSDVTPQQRGGERESTPRTRDERSSTTEGTATITPGTDFNEKGNGKYKDKKEMLDEQNFKEKLDIGPSGGECSAPVDASRGDEGGSPHRHQQLSTAAGSSGGGDP